MTDSKELSTSVVLADRQQLLTKLEENIARFNKAAKKAKKRWAKHCEKLLAEAHQEAAKRAAKGYPYAVKIDLPLKPKFHTRGLRTFTERVRDDVRDQLALSPNEYTDYVYAEWIETQIEAWGPVKKDKVAYADLRQSAKSWSMTVSEPSRMAY